MKTKLLIVFAFLVTWNTASATVFVEPPMEDLVETFDTICWQDTYDYRGYTFHLPSCEGYEQMQYIDYVLEYRDKDNCTIYRLNLAIKPIKHVTVEETILLGDTLFFCGDTLVDEGVYDYALTTVSGCDSLVKLTLQTALQEVVMNAITIADMCADVPVLTMQFDFTGRVDEVAVRIKQDSSYFDLYDTIVPMAADSTITIQYDTMRAGVYELDLQGYYHQIPMFEETATLTVLYPSAVLEQRWDDVICVLTSGYNGGYHFTQFQWYKNGQPLQGETGYYLNHPLEQGAEYSALLTDDNGIQLMTCPLTIASEEPDVTVEPTLVTKQQPVRCYVSEDAMLYLYDALGRMIMSTPIAQGETYLRMPAIQGVYLMKVVLQDNQERNVKIMIN
ncbi:MAG: T9SS type A sorting domain-containing protein [Paludibacteraceae bacterium]|nr:T9SS type A sorting domain-containing protein [Paludibacteraceae bacterium]